MRVGLAFLRLAAVALVAIGLWPALARAATLTTVPDAYDHTLTLQALPGETNDISIQHVWGYPYSPYEVQITDSGAPLTIGSGDGCSLVDPHTADCHMDVGRVLAGDGDDKVETAQGTLVSVDGGPGDDVVTVTDSNWPGNPYWPSDPQPPEQMIDGGPGNDTIGVSGSHDASILGGDGNDSITVGPWFEGDVDAGPGDDSIVARGGETQPPLFPWEAREGEPRSIRGGDGNDSVDVSRLFGTVVSGGTGDDTIRSLESEVTLHGDDGNDRISAAGPSLPRGWPQVALVAGGGPGDDTVTGSDVADVITGGDGNDVLSGIGGDDQLDGGGGDDRVDGGDGSDVVAGGLGNDVLLGGNGDDTLLDGPGADLLSGGAGSERIDYSARTTPITVVDAGAHPPVTTGEVDRVAGDVESIVLSAGNDSYYGGSTPSNVQGGPGDDTLVGGTAADGLSGGPGADTIAGGDGADVLDGGDGADVIDGGAGDDVIDGGTGDDGLSGGDGNDTIDAADFPGLNFSPLIPLGRGDDISCGSGWDSITADYYDAVPFDSCEAVRDGSNEWRSARAARRRVVLKARCAWLIDRRCRGAVRLSWSNYVPAPRSALARTEAGVPARVRGCAAAHRARVLGSGAFSLAPGRVNRVAVRLTARGQRLLGHRHCLLARATFRFRAPGRRMRTMTRTLALRPARR